MRRLRSTGIKIDTIRALAVYGIAAYIVWKTLTMLEGMVAAGTVGGDAALGIIGGLVLAVAGFLFAAEQSKGTQAAFERGLNTPTPPAPNVTPTTFAEADIQRQQIAAAEAVAPTPATPAR